MTPSRDQATPPGSPAGASAVAAALTRWVARHARLVLAVVVVCALAGALTAVRLEPDAATSTLVDRDSTEYQDNLAFQKQFGGDPVYVLVSGSLPRVLYSTDLGVLVGLEGCLSGNVPKGAPKPAGPCGEIADLKPASVVYGPGTFVNESARQIAGQFEVFRQRRAAEAERAATAAERLAAAKGYPPAEQKRLGEKARQLVYAEFARDTLQLAVKYGIRSIPALNNIDFVSALVFDPKRGASTPKARFAYIFPNSRHALIQVRLRPDLTEAQRTRAIELFRQAVRDPQFKLDHGSYLVTGTQALVDDASKTLQRSLAVLLLVAVVVMAATLALVFRTRRRLLPLLLALCAVGITFGVMTVVGIPLTMASVAVLPVLLGLGVDYAIQFQARFAEERDRGDGDATAAAVAAAAAGGPTIAAACAATAAGFLVLLLSPVPMVRGFGVVLVVGIAIAFLCAFLAGFAALSLGGRGGSAGRFGQAARRRLQGVGEALAGAWRLLASTALAGYLRNAFGAVAGGVAAAGRGTLALAVSHPRRVLCAGLALAAIGWVADTQTKVVSDPERLVPQDLQALQDVKRLQHATGVVGEVDVTVRGRDVSDPAVFAWMNRYEQRVLRRHGYSEGRGCGEAQLCPGTSVAQLVQAALQGQTPTQRRIKAVLDAIPPYFAQAVVTGDRSTANIAFGMRVMPLDEAKRVIDDMRAQLNPPPGVSVTVSGLPTLVADSNARLADSRRMLVLAGLLAVFLVLLAVYRRLERALVPLLPIALATGWSALVLFALRIPLNPMSATLGALVIAISTEFSVLLTGRYRQERERTADVATALRRTYRSTGLAVTASGCTAIAGFVALVFSDIRMLRDFGLVTVVDLAVSLVGVLVVLPAALSWAEQRGPIRLPAWLRLPGRRRAARARP